MHEQQGCQQQVAETEARRRTEGHEPEWVSLPAAPEGSRAFSGTHAGAFRMVIARMQADQRTVPATWPTRRSFTRDGSRCGSASRFGTISHASALTVTGASAAFKRSAAGDISAQ